MAQDTSTRGAPSPTRWLSLAGSCTAAGLVWLAFADLGVAIPTIADDLDADLNSLQWANNAFSLVTGALVIAAGRFADVFGRRRMLLLGLAVFAGCSVVSATADGLTMLVVGRGLMGIGAALILPATLALIPPQFSGKAQLTAFGIWQAVAWGGQAIGPAIGGAITDGPGWSWLFWINLPLAALSFAAVLRFTPESSDADASSHVDWPGLVTIGLAVFALLYALTDGPTKGWTDPVIIGLFAAAAMLAVAWVLIERRVADPLVDLSLFRIRPYDGALTANLTMNLAFAGVSYLLVLWLQNARGYSAIQAGMLMLPSTFGIFAFIPLGGRMSARRGSRRPVLIGLGILAVGLGILGLLDLDTTMLLIAAGLVVVGLGLGLLSTPISNTAVGDVPEHLAGTAAGVFKMSSMVGGALGVAVLSAIARSASFRDGDAAARAAGMTADDMSQARAALVGSDNFEDALSELPAELARKVNDAVVGAFTDGLAQTMVVTAVLALVALGVVSALWPSSRTRGTGTGEGAGSGADPQDDPDPVPA